MQLHAQRRQLSARRGDFITTIDSREFVRRGQVGIDWRFMMSKMKSGTQLESRRRSSRDHLVADMDRVLQMRQQHPFLDYDFANVISPDGEPIFESELS